MVTFLFKRIKLKNLIHKNWQLFASMGILTTITLILLLLSLNNNGGHFVYALDDPYIHIDMARNFVEHCQWGVDKHGFSSSTSSPLWVLLLSVNFMIEGTNDLAPFVLNFVFANLLLIISNLILVKKSKINPVMVFVILLSVILYTPLILIEFCGQEHVLHIVLTVVFGFLSSDYLLSENGNPRKFNQMLLLAPLLTFTRYEGLFMVLVVCVLLFCRRRALKAILLGFISLIPITIYGIISMANGWNFLPNSILLKGNSLSDFSLQGFINFLFINPLVKLFDKSEMHILVLIIVSMLVIIYKISKIYKFWNPLIIINTIFVLTAIIHTQFASIGLFYRYEAYLVTFGILAISVSVSENFPDTMKWGKGNYQLFKLAGATIIISIFLFPLMMRAYRSIKFTVPATSNIYGQQYQMGLFLNEYYQNKTVAANDIGAINFLADIRCIDLWGLANMDAARYRKEGQYLTAQMDEIVTKNHACIAIVYDEMLELCDKVPSNWIKMGEWTIPKRVSCFSRMVSFYAIDSTEGDELQKNLRAFSTSLPKDVVQSGKFMKY